MNPNLAALLASGEGLVLRDKALTEVSPWIIKRARRLGHLIEPLPRVYADPDRWADVDLRRRAGLAYVGDRGALSHTTALSVWGLHDPGPDEPIHLTVSAAIRLRSRTGFAFHQLARPTQSRVRAGFPVTSLERSLVDSWPLLPAEARTAVVIRGVNDRLTTPARIESALAATPKLMGRAELRRLLDRLAAGCRSPLEIWGFDHVFTGPGLAGLGRQVPIRVGTMTYYLDLYAEHERVNFEQDGAASHGDPRQREADLRRDAQLATLGILTVRFAARRLGREAAEVRSEALCILAARRP